MLLVTCSVQTQALLLCINFPILSYCSLQHSKVKECFLYCICCPSISLQDDSQAGIWYQPCSWHITHSPFNVSDLSSGYSLERSMTQSQLQTWNIIHNNSVQHCFHLAKWPFLTWPPGKEGNRSQLPTEGFYPFSFMNIFFILPADDNHVTKAPAGKIYPVGVQMTFFRLLWVWRAPKTAFGNSTGSISTDGIKWNQLHCAAAIQFPLWLQVLAQTLISLR